ncbi:hypothetical protein K438DRAFT_1782599 [Mycena galopus ATCC 62051]|nr:hypothetical protein K438DRAFT_1782599 [Mycena galopus ATCC 62051]
MRSPAKTENMTARQPRMSPAAAKVTRCFVCRSSLLVIEDGTIGAAAGCGDAGAGQESSPKDCALTTYSEWKGGGLGLVAELSVVPASEGKLNVQTTSRLKQKFMIIMLHGRNKQTQAAELQWMILEIQIGPMSCHHDISRVLEPLADVEGGGRSLRGGGLVMVEGERWESKWDQMTL